MDESFNHLKQPLSAIIETMNRHRWFLVVLMIGVGLRAWALWKTILINPDGALYIYQAKMLLNGHWKKLTNCGIDWISIYPFLIDAMHFGIKDWILSAQLVSTIFSTATLLPIYFLCRRFFGLRIAALATLIAALNPVMCSRSGGVVRDPIYWFFLALGIWSCLRFWDARGRWSHLYVASLSFIMAALARIEAVSMLAVTLVALLIWGGNNRLKKCLFFALPLLIAAIAIFTTVFILNIPMDRYLRVDNIIGEATAFKESYQQMRSQITNLDSRDQPEIVNRFLPEVRNQIWLVALGTLANRILEAFFYPFVLFFLIGYFALRQPEKNAAWRYLLLTNAMGMALLYLHLLNTWVMEYRFTMLVFIPALPFAAAGISCLMNILAARWHMRNQRVAIAIALFLLIAGLPKALHSQNADKIVFRQVAERIRKFSNGSGPLRIASSRYTHRLISIYANIDNPDPPCPEENHSYELSIYANDPDKIAQNLKQQNVRFYIYEERHWPLAGFNPRSLSDNEHFQLIGRWYHRDTGHMLLYLIR
jgi:Dolichyl-phosphate-mannose-protein mannosyltransferase